MSDSRWRHDRRRREFLRGTMMINRAKDYGLAHPGAAEELTLMALEADPANDNRLYVRTGLFLAARERKDAAATYAYSDVSSACSGLVPRF